jgi:hypothetical protein
VSNDCYSCVRTRQFPFRNGIGAAIFISCFANLLLSATPSSLVVGPATISGATATVPLSFTSGTGMSAGLEWTVSVPGASGVAVAAGPVATASGKALYCNGSTCLLSGLSTNTIANGVVATISVTIDSSVPGSLPVQLTNVTESLVDGTASAITSTDGSIALPNAPSSTSSPQSSAATLSSLQCADASVFSNLSTTCTVTLSAAAANDTTVALSVQQASVLTVPASVTIPAGAISASFVVNAEATPTPQTAMITASISGGTSTGFSLVVMPAPALLIQGSQAELGGMSNGSVITPTIAPSGFTGALVANSGGSANFSPTEGANGVYFLNCCANSGNAYYKFAGPAVGTIFNVNEGQISFYLQSRHSFAQRVATAPEPRYVFDVRDGNNNHLFFFFITTSTVSTGTYLEFYYMAAGTGGYYFAPLGTEDQIFGENVILKVRITWDGSASNLYLNDTLVKSTPFAAVTPSWTANSNFDLGAYEYYGFGGYNTCDDVISNFTVTAAPSGTSASQVSSDSVTLPAISTVNVVSVSSSAATISWTTNSNSTSQVAYGATSSYGLLSPLNSTLTTAHSVMLSGLAPSTTYHYQVQSVDGNGNEAISQDFTFTTTAAPGPQVLLQISGTSAEANGVTNGSIVTPNIGPSGFAGTVVVNGSGSANFPPAQNGAEGVYFLTCCSNYNNAYYKFTGSALGSLFAIPQGQISFYLTSRESFAQRVTTASAPRFAFDVRDGNGTHMYYFLTEISTNSIGTYLVFQYLAAGTGSYYYLPAGTEDQMFGYGTTLQVTIRWDGTKVTLLLNGTLVKSTPYTQALSNWDAGSVFDFGAYEYQTFGGYNSSDDVISTFTVSTLSGQ